MYQIVKYYQENSQAIDEFRAASRFLWDDHVSYTRNAIVSILADLPDADAISLRLIQNQEDIGSFIAPYYSIQQTSMLVDLLTNHITIAVEVIKGTEGAEASWRANGNELVMQMYRMNPQFWPMSITSSFWTRHLDMTIEQINARKAETWQYDIAAYDLNHQHMNKFSDLFSNGVIYQNIDKFCIMDY